MSQQWIADRSGVGMGCRGGLVDKEYSWGDNDRLA